MRCTARRRRRPRAQSRTGEGEGENELWVSLFVEFRHSPKFWKKRLPKLAHHHQTPLGNLHNVRLQVPRRPLRGCSAKCQRLTDDKEATMCNSGLAAHCIRLSSSKRFFPLLRSHLDSSRLIHDRHVQLDILPFPRSSLYTLYNHSALPLPIASRHGVDARLLSPYSAPSIGCIRVRA